MIILAVAAGALFAIVLRDIDKALFTTQDKEHQS